MQYDINLKFNDAYETQLEIFVQSIQLSFAKF